MRRQDTVVGLVTITMAVVFLVAWNWRRAPATHHARFLVVVTQSNVVESSYVVVSNTMPVKLTEQMANDLHRYVAARARMGTNTMLLNVVRLEEP